LNLSGRLQRIRTLNGSARAETRRECQSAHDEHNSAAQTGGVLPHPLAAHSFSEAGCLTLRRTVTVDLAEPLRADLSATLPALTGALEDSGGGLRACDLVFFDLETTGLSGGTGTVAFLAAFGRFSGGNYAAIEVDQYLLLDHAGEEDFLRLIEPHFAPSTSGRAPLIVSYNGKCFDSQIIRGRYLVSGMPPPPIARHADLLYPARCLWKKKLPSCSQSEIEKNILRIDRGDDIPGSRAPDIWFAFLKTNDAAELAGVCRHNLFDIAGLASILGALDNIARDPARYGEKYDIDFEALARRIRKYRRLHNAAYAETALAERTALEAAVRLGSPLAAFLLGKDLLREGRSGAAYRLLSSLADRTDTALAAAAARALAIDSEWRLMDIELALHYAEKALPPVCADGALKADSLRRRERLVRKLEAGRLQPELVRQPGR
jgi:uncharacterized protein YprB with RNaseH-like and TPR domain